jgi:hypothetical protein
VPWQVLQELLVADLSDPEATEKGAQLLRSLGYIDYHLHRLAAGRLSVQLEAIAHLKLMRAQQAIPNLLAMLPTKNSLIAQSALEALASIGSKQAMEGILCRLPDLYEMRALATPMLLTQLSRFGSALIPPLIRIVTVYPDEPLIVLALRLLQVVPTQEGEPLIRDYLLYPKSSVRLEALKALQQLPLISAFYYACPKLMEDPWPKVREQVASALGKIKSPPALLQLKKLVFDRDERVRQQASRQLALSGIENVLLWLEILQSGDAYAREALCEQLQMTGQIADLICHIDNPHCEKALYWMHALHRSAPLLRAVDDQTTPIAARHRLYSILAIGGTT